MIDALATYRLTRLLQQDSLPPLPAVRDALMARVGSTPASELLDCPWCLSVWLGAIVVVLRRVCPRLWDLVAPALAASAVTGLLSQVAAELEREPATLTMVEPAMPWEEPVVDEPKG